MTSSAVFPIPVSPLKPVSCGSVLWRSSGVLRATIIVKISLGLVHERSAWPTTPLELVMEDRRRDANPLSSLVEAGEVAPFLPNTGVILFAQAHAPQGRPAPAMSARLALFRDRSLIDKTVHVFGERAANAPQHPRPFERVPLVYERTWGGPGSEENPVGVAANSPTLPSICDSTNPTKPAGFGPISRQWPQRKRLLGLSDLSRLEGSIADIPNGFDFRYYNPAPLDQQIEYLRGDEWIVLDGMHPTFPRVQSRLPQMRGKACVYFTSGNTVSHNQIVDLLPDLLVIDADKLIASVVFRGNLTLDSADVLPRLRVFADVELPGNPTRWPEGAEVLRAPAPMPLNVAVTPSPVAPAAAIFTTLPGREDSARRSSLPFQPKPPGQATVVPFMAAPPARPNPLPESDDPLMRTRVADGEESGIRPPMPFAARPGSVPPPRVAPPPPPRRRADADNATRAIDLEELEAKRAAVTPFEESSSRGFNFSKPEFKPVSRTIDDGDESTRAIDLEALEAKRAAVTPFAASDAAKPVPAAAHIPGAPWAAPRGNAPTPASVRPPAFNIEDPQTQAVSEGEFETLPFTKPGASSGSAPPSVPPPPARFEAPPMFKPPAFVEPPRQVEAPVRVEPPPRFEAPAMVRPSAPPMPVDASAVPTVPATVPFVPKDLTPAPVVAAPPPAVVPEEPPVSAPTPPPAPAAAIAPAEVVEAVEESSVRATILERLKSKVPAPLHGLTVTGEDLSGLDMRGANLSGHDLSNVKLCKTNLSGARLGGAKLVEADLDGADLSNVDLANADLSRATLTNVRMSGAIIDNANFTSVHATGAILDGARGRAAAFVRGQWTNASFRGMDVLGADFTGATLDGSVFEKAVLPDVKLNDSRGKSANFDDARLDQGRADGAVLTESSFKRVQAKGSIWENATLDGSLFEEGRMEESAFVRASCKETKFIQTNLRAANFGKAQGDAANFSDATLDGADFRQARFAEARFDGARMANLMAPRADFSKSNFSRADLSNGSLRAAVMSGANLAHANLDGADLRDADLKRSVLFKASRTGAKMNGANTKDAIETEPSE